MKHETQNNKLVTGEVVGGSPVERGGVFIGTLNIMTEPARALLTEPLLNVYKSRYEGKFKRPKHVFAFDAGLILLGAALAIVAIYFGFIFKPFDPIQIRLAIAPKAPIAGSEVVITLNVSNQSDEAMQNASAVVKLPKEIAVLRSSLPWRRDENRVVLGTIDGKTDVTERLVGKLTGGVGGDLRVTASIVYADAKTKETKSRAAAATLKIAGSLVGAEFDLPERIIIGQTFDGNIRYFNRGNETVRNVVITPNWPDGFALVSSDPSIKNGRWNIAAIAPGSEGRIEFAGAIVTNANEADLTVDANGSQSMRTVALIDPAINVTMSGADKARLGDTIDLVASYKNEGDHTIANALIKTVLDDGLKLVSVDKLNLAEIKPGGSGSFDIKVRVADVLPDALKDSENIQFKLRAGIAGKFDGGDEVAILSPAYSVKIASRLGLASLARYWSESGDQLGRGPMPPAVGAATRYWIFWSVKNTTNAVNNVRVTAQLPANVGYTGKASVPFGDAPEYDPGSRTLTWNVGDIPAWPGVTSSAVSAGFELSLIPTPDQIGTYPTLITGQKITGIDASTGLNLVGSTSDINSNLTSDPKAVGTGPVK